ncbi:MAG TPA: PhnD/SsuA/transferrin family substrate-binding protein, partial [Actinomycetota bacterium]|nr:PhnD/SsuA/transferrin family substrate-binding protein [Actinomycetota bacterium]
VARGEVDGSAIDSHVLAIELRDDPETAGRLRAVDSLGPSTIQPIAVSRRVPEGVREAIRDVLVAMHNDRVMRPTLGAGLIERFVPVDASSYDDIRMMLDACERAAFLELR